MTDRELLEAAAKAAWLSVVRCRLDDPLFRDMLLPAVDGRGIGWNPLTDDGDALRLAVKLNISLGFGGRYTAAYAGSPAAPQFSERWDSDPNGATRRAIVRAAAAIGGAA